MSQQRGNFSAKMQTFPKFQVVKSGRYGYFIRYRLQYASTTAQ